MSYLALISILGGLMLGWSVLGTVRRRRRDFHNQERLASAFNRSQSIRVHGPGAQGITQNILIANWGASSPTLRRHLP